jgi:hypothetical protein
MTFVDDAAHKLGTRMGRTWFGFFFIVIACGFAGFIAIYGIVDALQSGVAPCPGSRCQGSFSSAGSPLFFWGTVVFFFASAVLSLGLAGIYAIRFLRYRLES